MYCLTCQTDRDDGHLFCYKCGSLLEEAGPSNPAGDSTICDPDADSRRLYQLAEHHPGNCRIQKMYGDELFRRGQLIEAEARYRVALELRPKDIELRYHLCIVLYYQARLSEALRELREVLAAAPNLSAAHYRMGLTCFHLGDFTTAVHHLKRCAQLTPEYEMAHYHLGVVYAKMGKVDEAIEQFNHQLDIELKDSASRVHLDELFRRKWNGMVT